MTPEFGGCGSWTEPILERSRDLGQPFAEILGAKVEKFGELYALEAAES